METINGISFEDWAAASAHISQGMALEEALKVLEIEEAVWVDTNGKWGAKLGELMVQDMNFSKKYSDIFTNPKVGKFAHAKSDILGIDDLMKIVPNLDTYQKIFWHQSLASQHGVDPSSILESYGLDLGKWGTVSGHYSTKGINALDFDAPDYNDQFHYYSDMIDNWKNHWTEYYNGEAVDLAEDLDF